MPDATALPPPKALSRLVFALAPALQARSMRMKDDLAVLRSQRAAEEDAHVTHATALQHALRCARGTRGRPPSSPWRMPSLPPSRPASPSSSAHAIMVVW